MSEIPKHNMLGSSGLFLEVVDQLTLFAKTDVTILIEGETGTGKELAARAAHEYSSRQGKPFIPVNCGALPGELAETELFGCEKGAYTDARQSRHGLVMEANNGTLFLDEVEVMPLRVQVALLRFLQDHCFRPVGSSTTLSSNVRIIAATNIPLEELANKTVFRSDLLFRLKVLSVHLPPLRERGDDVLILAKAFLHRYCKKYALKELKLSENTESWFKRYHWPGNVRELENVLLRGVFLCKGSVLDLPVPDNCKPKNPNGSISLDSNIPLDLNFSEAKAAVISNFEHAYLANVLQHAEGNVTRAARMSGTDCSAFRKLLRRNNLDADAYRSKSHH